MRFAISALSQSNFRMVPWLVLVLGLCTTYVVYDIAQQHTREAVREEFGFRFNEISNDIKGRLAGYEQVLRGTAGMLATQKQVERQEFRRYVEMLRLEQSYPGIQGVGYSVLIAAAAKEQHVHQIRGQGFPDYAIRPAGSRSVYTAIVFLEPFNGRNQRAFGFDMFSEPKRRAAMERARDENRAIVSRKVKLVQETEHEVQAGFLMYFPVYQGGIAPQTVQQRRDALLGWAYAPFRMNDLMRGILGKYFGELGESLELRIYDGTAISAADLMYDSSAMSGRPAVSHKAVFQYARPLDVGGHRWLVSVNSLPAFEAKLASQKGRWIILVGISASLLVALVVWLLVNGRERAVRFAEAMNRDLLETDRQLRESERYQQALLANLPVAVVVHGSDSAIRYCNTVAQGVLGMPAEHIVGRRTSELQWNFLRADGSVMPVEEYPVQQVLANRQPLRGYIVGLTQKGETGIRWVLVNAYPDTGAGGQLEQVVVSFVDITSLRAAETSLRMALKELDDLYDHAPCGYHSLDQDGLIVRINQTELDWLGYTREEVLGRVRFVDLLTPDSVRLFRENYPPFMQRGWVRDIEYELLCKDGRVLPVSLSATAIRGRDGNYVMSRSTVYDISERRQAEMRLRNLNRFYSVLSRANEAIVRTRAPGQLFEAICQIAVEDGQFLMAWIGLMDEQKGEIIPVAHWGNESGYLEYLRHIGVLGLGGPTAQALQAGEYRLSSDIAGDGNMNPWREEALRRGYRSSAAFPLYQDDRVVGAINLYADRADYFDADIIQLLEDLAKDVSFSLGVFEQQERRALAETKLHDLNQELEQRIAERTRQLETANRELETFSYSVSHDLRAPLRTIDGFSDILQKTCAANLDEKGNDYLARVRRASKRMGELIDDLLLLSSVTRAELRKERVDLSRMIESMMAEMRENAPDRRVEWLIQPDVSVHADSRLMRIVLENLLGNAWKFTALREAARIEFGLLEQEGEKVIFIRDNGAGFDMKYASKLFGAFQRLHRAEEFEGTGIGLATVQRVIHRHGGRVWAEGKVGAGATIYFTL